MGAAEEALAYSSGAGCAPGDPAHNSAGMMIEKAL
jgi:hypothetical protein